jgi:hypothetical protein
MGHLDKKRSNVGKFITLIYIKLTVNELLIGFNYKYRTKGMRKTIVNLVEANLESSAGVWTVGRRHTIIGHDFSLLGIYKLMSMNYLYIYFDDFTLPIINFPDLNCLLFESTWFHSCLFNRIPFAWQSQ